jgi:hypothetical protein
MKPGSRIYTEPYRYIHAVKMTNFDLELSNMDHRKPRFSKPIVNTVIKDYLVNSDGRELTKIQIVT